MGFHSFQISGMPFQRRFCPACGARMKRKNAGRAVTTRTTYHEFESTSVNGTHFAVTDEPNIFIYHPRFSCTDCRRQYTEEDAEAAFYVGKMLGKRRLTPAEIATCREEAEEKAQRRGKIWSFVISALSFALFLSALALQFQEELLTAKGLVCAAVGLLIFFFPTLRRLFNRKYAAAEDERQIRTAIFHKAEAATHGTAEELRERISCYCIYCMQEIDPHGITQFEDEGRTAVCPRCSKTSLLPEAPVREGDEALLTDLKNYWYWY